MKKIMQFLRLIVEDLLILLGLVFINFATFLLHTIAGWYVLGLSFIAIGITLARLPPKRG